MAFKIKKKETPYVQIDTRIFEDTRISWDAKGLYCHLVSLKKPSIELSDLKERSRTSMENTLKALKELERYGWLSGGGS